MLAIRDLHFSLGGRKLFEAAAVSIPEGKRVGVVGRNGGGKTTLFRLIRGELSPDEGAIETPRDARIGGVAQEAPDGDESLLDTVLAADLERAALMAEAETASDPTRIAEIQTRLADIGAHAAEARAASILAGLGFDQAAQARPCREFSGGWRMRVALAAALFAEPDLLLLDEPTNYLDLEGSLWLESYLARYPRTCLIISHDRGLLNRAVDSILHLEHLKLTYYTGGYDSFEAERRAKLDQQMSAKKKQDAARAHIQSFVDRFRYKASKARQAQARLKMLERMQPIPAVVEQSVAAFAFPEPEELSPPLISLRGASAGYDGRAVLSDLDLRIDQDDRIALLGANGQGKSTLAKLISDRLPAMGGEVVRHRRLRIGYFAQHQLDELTPGDTPLQHIQRLRPDETPTKLRARLGAAALVGDLADQRVEKLSGGQKARLLMMLAVLNAPHLLILDEPTNHLDVESREALAQALATYDGAVILISHDAHLVESVADRLWLVGDGRVRPFEDDMATYAKLLLSQRGGRGAAREAEPEKGGEKRAGRRSAATTRQALAPLRAELEKCEQRVGKLEQMRSAIEARLADPTLYDGPADRLEALNRKRAEILDGLARAEALWVAALERYETKSGRQGG